MQRGRHYIGLPVVVVESGRRGKVGSVSDIFFDEKGAVAALGVTPTRGVLRQEKVIAASAFSRIDAEGAQLHDADGMNETIKGDGLQSLSVKKRGLTGRPIYDERGDQMGFVGDVLTADGHMQGYEKSQGVVLDWLHGRQRIPLQRTRTHDDHIVVTDGDVLYPADDSNSSPSLY